MKNNWQDDLDDDWNGFIFWPVIVALGLLILFLFVTNPSI
jgi:hypothetical protein